MREIAADADSISEFPRSTIEVLLEDQILSDCESLEVACEDDLVLQLSLSLSPCDVVGYGEVFLRVVTHHLENGLVGAVDILEFGIENRVDPVGAPKQFETVLPAISGEERALVGGYLSIQIDLAGPPSGGAVFELQCHRSKARGAVGSARDSFGIDFKFVKLFHVRG